MIRNTQMLNMRAFDAASQFIFMIGFIMAGITERKQALHDLLAETLVVKKR